MLEKVSAALKTTPTTIPQTLHFSKTPQKKIVVIKAAFGSCLVEKSEFHQIWCQDLCEIHRFHLQCKAPTRIGALKTEKLLISIGSKFKDKGGVILLSIPCEDPLHIFPPNAKRKRKVNNNRVYVSQKKKHCQQLMLRIEVLDQQASVIECC